MNKLILSFFSVTLIGCTHQASLGSRVVLPFASDLVELVQHKTERAPASFELEVSEEKSTRRVYFSALYHQYLTLGQFLKVESNISFCPQFHHDKIETDGFITPVLMKSNVSSVTKEEQVYFPEMAFNKRFSLKDHHEVIRGELEVLCEDGFSDDFYKFDNLVTNYANKKSFHMKPQAMASVLKIPVFANYYLVKMLQAENIGFEIAHPEERRMIKLTNTTWFEQYITEAIRLRKNFLRTKVVKR